MSLVKPLGTFMAAVYEGRRTFLSPLIAPLERCIYRDNQVSCDRKFGIRILASDPSF